MDGSQKDVVSLHYELDLGPESAWIMATPDPSVKQAAPYVLELGDFYAREKYYTRRRNLPSFLIKYTLGGAGTLSYGGRDESISERRAFWIDCVEPQYYRTAEGADGWHVIWMHFYGPGCQAYYDWFLNATGGGNAVTLPVGTAVPALMAKLMAIYRGGDNTPIDDIAASALVTDIMAELVAAAAREPQKGAAEMPRAVMCARAHLMRNYREPISLSELSQMYALDRFYFQKLFKRHIGLSPKKFQALVRMNRAKELLQTTDRAISDIAGMVGIDSASRFIALFRSYEGMTPGKYREQWRRK